MKIRYIVFHFFLFLSLSVSAQPPEITYQGEVARSGYVNNVSYGPFNIGFNFQFFENSYSEFYVSSNGLVTFGTGSSASVETTIPDPSLPNNLIAAFWDDLVVDAMGNILYKTIGAAPNRKLIIQFRNMGFYPSPVYMGTFSVILYETTNKIQIQYRLIVLKNNDLAKGGSATIGIENSDGSAGVLYKYHDPTAVSTSKAVSFSPSGLTYSLDTNAVYDGIYLTTNLSLPEPAISYLISPADEAVVGINNTFSWSEAEFGSNYTLRISNSPVMAFATSYNAGSGLSYVLNDLLPDTTYYWTILSSNSTGFTWNEVRSFRTSNSPPLAALQRTIYVEQGTEKLIELQYTGGDGSPVTATVTGLPPQGSLYQVSGGLKGAKITSVPAAVTDPGRQVIYGAEGATGNGAGNFNFYVTDNTGNSPAAQVTINVIPPGSPNVLAIARNTGVEIQFDLRMNDPAGKQNQFTVTVNGTPVPVTSVALKPGDPYSFLLTLATPLSGGETVIVSYTMGDVSATTGGLLLSFVSDPVTLLSQTINFPVIADKKYGEPDYVPGASASSGGAITYSSSNLAVATIVLNKVHFTGVGSSIITARQAGNATYAPARYERPLTVLKGDQTIAFSVIPVKTYGDPPFALNATASSSLSVAFSSDNPAVATVSGNIVTIHSAGTAIITASQAGNSLWNPAPDVQRTLTVNKADQTIAFSVIPVKTYGDPDFALDATASSALSVAFSSDNPAVATVTGNMVHITGAGTATITASQAGNANYNPAPDVQRTLTVNKADQTITFSAIPEKTYGDPDFALEALVSSGLSVVYTSDNPAVATITGYTVHITGAGTAVITASQPGNTNYNPAADVQQTLTVNKASQVITVTRKPENMLAADTFHLRATATSGLAVQFESSNTGVVSVSGNILTGVSKGEAVIRAFNGGNANYLAAPDVTFTVTVKSSHPNILYLFTPNGDGFNDYWELPLSQWGRCEVKVYNRWGKLVYDNPGYNNLWDGTSGGNPVPEGAYYFIVKTETLGIIKGTVNIVR